MKYLLVPCLLVAFDVSVARSDVPDMPLTSMLADICKDARAAVTCPTCACEAVTQTPPGTWSDVSDVTHGLVVRVYGELSPGRMAEHYVAALGGAKGFKYGGVLADASILGRAEEPFFAGADVSGASSVMDMCAGACEHDPVGPVHVFMVKKSVTQRSDDFIDTETIRETLVPCFEKGGEVQCWQVPIAETVVRKKPRLEPGDKEKILAKGSWKRTWSFGGPNGMELVLGKAKGTGKHNLKEHPEITDGSTFFHVIGSRPDVTPLPR